MDVSFHQAPVTVFLSDEVVDQSTFINEWAADFEKRYGELRREIEEIMRECACNYPQAIAGRKTEDGLPVFSESGGVWAHLEFRGVDLIDDVEFELWYTFSWAPKDYHVIHFEEWEACSGDVEDKSPLFINA